MDDRLITIIKHAGKLLLKYRWSNKQYQNKSDNSPVTEADKASHGFLDQQLRKISGYPVLSEENVVSFDKRSVWDKFWLIDPLDGTKEFINGYSDFCINITLISKNKPIFGLIYAPLLDELYIAEKNCKVRYIGREENIQRPIDDDGRAIIAGVSRFHNSEATEQFLRINGFSQQFKLGSALKFGRLAMGQFDIYPRFEGSYEWDIASGHAILSSADCTIFDLKTKNDPLYNKEDLHNNFFIACRNIIGPHNLKL